MSLYVDGVRLGNSISPGDLDWDGGGRLLLASLPTAEQRWMGELYAVALHDRAFAEDEVRGNYFPPVRLRASGSLGVNGRFDFTPGRSQAYLLFTGDIDIREDGQAPGAPPSARFLLDGRLSVFPDWSAIEVGARISAKIDSAGETHLDQSVSVALPDFVLLDSILKVADDHVILSGRWLGESIVFTARERDGQLVFEGTVSFAVPAGSSLGPLVDPVTAATLATDIEVGSIQTTLAVELTAGGFFEL